MDQCGSARNNHNLTGEIMSESFAMSGGDNQDSEETTSNSQEQSTQQVEGDVETNVEQTGNTFQLKAGDRTFNSQDDVTKHIEHAQGHISRLETENADLRNRLQEAESKLGEVDNLKEQVEALMKEVQKEQTGEESSQTGTIDVNGLVKAVKTELQQEALVSAAKSNFQKSKEAAEAKWGADYLTKIAERASELQLSVDDIDTMAKKSPAAFRKIILEEGDKPADRSSEFTDTSVNSVSMANRNTQQPGPSTRFTKMSTKERAAEVQRRIKEASQNS